MFREFGRKSTNKEIVLLYVGSFVVISKGSFVLGDDDKVDF